MFKLNPIKQAVFEGFFQRITGLPDPTPDEFAPNPNLVMGAHDYYFYQTSLSDVATNVIRTYGLGIEFSAIDLITPSGGLWSNFTAVSVARPSNSSAHFYAYPSDDPSPQTNVNGSRGNNPRRRQWNEYRFTRGGDVGSDDPPWVKTLVITAVVNDDMSLVRAARPDLDIETALELTVSLDNEAIEHTFLYINDDDPFIAWSFNVDNTKLNFSDLISDFSAPLTFPMCDFTGLRNWAVYLRDKATGEYKDMYHRARPSSFYFDPILVYDVGNPSTKYLALALRGFRRASYVNIPAEYARNPERMKELELVFCYYGTSKTNNVIDFSNERLAVSNGQTMSFRYGREEDHERFYSESGFVPNTTREVGEPNDVNYRAMLNSVTAVTNRMNRDLTTMRNEAAAEAGAIQDSGKTYEDAGAYLGLSLQALNTFKYSRGNGSVGSNSPAVISTSTSFHGGAINPWVVKRTNMIEGGDPYAATYGLYMYYEAHQFNSALIDREFNYTGDYGNLFIRTYASFIDFDLYNSPDGNKYYVKRIRMVRTGDEFVPEGSRGTKCAYEMYGTIINNVGEVMVDNELLWRGNLLYTGSSVQIANGREDITGNSIVTKNIDGVESGWIDLFDSPYEYNNPSDVTQSYAVVAYGTLTQESPPTLS